jgi:hypothetical protein
VYSEEVVNAKGTAFIKDQENQTHTQVIFHTFDSPQIVSFLFCADNDDNVGKYHIVSGKVVWENNE